MDADAGRIPQRRHGAEVAGRVRSDEHQVSTGVSPGRPHSAQEPS
jgi:hypothetical protein